MCMRVDSLRESRLCRGPFASSPMPRRGTPKLHCQCAACTAAALGNHATVRLQADTAQQLFCRLQDHSLAPTQEKSQLLSLALLPQPQAGSNSATPISIGARIKATFCLPGGNEFSTKLDRLQASHVSCDTGGHGGAAAHAAGPSSACEHAHAHALAAAAPPPPPAADAPPRVALASAAGAQAAAATEPQQTHSVRAPAAQQQAASSPEPPAAPATDLTPHRTVEAMHAADSNAVVHRDDGLQAGVEMPTLGRAVGGAFALLR